MNKVRSMFLYICLTLIISAMVGLFVIQPLAAKAAETHDHSSWTETASLPTSSGSYYLTGNVSGSWTVPSGTVDLCLNGKTISGGITVPSGATLNIYDEGSGKVSTSGTVIIVQNGGKAYICGGTYETSNSYAISVVSGGFIQIDSGTINGASRDGNATILNKGTGIINNATVSGGSNAVYSQDYGKTYIYGGNFESTSYNSMAVGTNAYMYINMTNGGVISNDVSGKYAINVLGTAEIDYAITSSSGTAININSSASATINGGSFNSTSNDTVTNSGTLTITGGSFTGKQYAVKNSGTFNLSDSPTFSSEQADIYLASGKKINITDALNNSTPYSVLTAATPGAGSPVEITNSSNTSYNNAAKFTSKNSSYVVRKNSDTQLELAMLTNPCTVNFDYQDDVTALKTVAYESGDEYGELPVPTRTGYIFKGWYTDTDGKGTKIESTDNVNESLTLYAYWEAETGGGTGDGDNTGGDNTDPSEENITVDSERGENAPKVTISGETSEKLKEEVIESHLTSEEKAAIADGETLEIILVVEDAGNTVPADDKQAAEAVLTNKEYTLGMYLNIDLIKKINGQQAEKITEINSPIRITIEIPENLRNNNRKFAIVRVHNGVAEILEDIDNDPDTITIATNKFSTYSIAYQDTAAVNPGNSNNPGTGTTPSITGTANNSSSDSNNTPKDSNPAGEDVSAAAGIYSEKDTVENAVPVAGSVILTAVSLAMILNWKKSGKKS